MEEDSSACRNEECPCPRGCEFRDHPLKAAILGGTSSGEVTSLVREAEIFAAAHGMMCAPDRERPTSFVPLPLTLFPSPLPFSCFEQALALAVPFNELVHAVAADSKFLCDVLASAAETDEFMARLIEVYKKSLEFAHVQRGELGIHRSDYMIDSRNKSEERLLQVELNTISSAFPMISEIVCGLHNHILLRCCSDRVPVSQSAVVVPDAIAMAWKVFDVPEAVVLMVVQPSEDTVLDQRKMEYDLLLRHKIRVIRRSLTEIHERGLVAEGTGDLSIDGFIVAVAYFRAGYVPKDYPTEKEWMGRSKLECSSAIKCPNAAYQLVGSKKIQQELAREEILERFVACEDRRAQLKACFAGLYSLDEAEGDISEIVERALKNPEAFVMKPQREGGGNNLYGEDLRDALKRLSKKELSAYILMDRICPAEFDTLVLRRSTLTATRCISEFGVYSTFLSNKSGVIVNREAGFLLRTKDARTEDGGVSAGIAVMDSPFLIS